MQEIYTEFLPKIFEHKKKIEKELKVKLTNKGKNLFITGSAENEYITLEVIEAINLGFSVDRALLLKNENMILQTLNIKNTTRRKNWEVIRGRIIGTHGKTLKTINKLSNCFISLHDNQVGIIGSTEEIEQGIQALKSLIQGSKQGNVYARLEKEKKQKRFRERLGAE